MELEGFVTGLGIACFVGFLGCVIALCDMQARIGRLERDIMALFDMSDRTSKNDVALAQVVETLARRRSI